MSRSAEEIMRQALKDLGAGTAPVGSALAYATDQQAPGIEAAMMGPAGNPVAPSLKAPLPWLEPFISKAVDTTKEYLNMINAGIPSLREQSTTQAPPSPGLPQQTAASILQAPGSAVNTNAPITLAANTIRDAGPAANDLVPVANAATRAQRKQEQDLVNAQILNRDIFGDSAKYFGMKPSIEIIDNTRAAATTGVTRQQALETPGLLTADGKRWNPTTERWSTPQEDADDRRMRMLTDALEPAMKLIREGKDIMNAPGGNMRRNEALGLLEAGQKMYGNIMGAFAQMHNTDVTANTTLTGRALADETAKQIAGMPQRTTQEHENYLKAMADYYKKKEPGDKENGEKIDPLTLADQKGSLDSLRKFQRDVLLPQLMMAEPGKRKEAAKDIIDAYKISEDALGLNRQGKARADAQKGMPKTKAAAIAEIDKANIPDEDKKKLRQRVDRYYSAQ